MSIRNTVQASLLLLLALFLLASGWLAMAGMDTFQAGFLRQVRAELLDQGVVDFTLTARQFCDHYLALPPGHRPGQPGVPWPAMPESPDATQYLLFDKDGKPGSGISLDPRLQSLIDGDLLRAFYEEAARGEKKELTVDNFQASRDNEGIAPAIIHLRALTDEGILLGMGSVRELADIRVLALGDAGAALATTTARQSGGRFILLLLAALSLTWLVLHLVLLRPIGNIFAHTGIGSGSGLTWTDLKDYAGQLREVTNEQLALRGKLERELESRFRAEEERDRLRFEIDRALQKYERGIQERYAAEFHKAQCALMEREARALKRRLQEPLAIARDAAAAQPGAEAVVDVLDRCLDTVRGLAAGDSDDLAHNPRQLALKPWLEDVVRRFNEAHGAGVQTNIQNSVYIQIDPAPLETALEYILDNALYASAGAPIALDAFPTGEDVEIRIIDHGAGIDDTARPHILIPFYTASGTGEGLGLAITRAVIRRHGGNLTIRSEVSKGTAIVITLPRAARA